MESMGVPAACGAEPGTKGAGFRGGPERWAGGGPQLAPHIPWPEIFDHHISVVEGHLKMVEMVKKHTVPDTSNWRTISAIVDRSYELLRMAKDASRSCVPPAAQLEQFPIRVSSASMYSGYSHADHEYSKPAHESGMAIPVAEARGIEIQSKRDSPEFELAQAKGIKQRTLAPIRVAKAAQGEGGTGSGSDAQLNSPAAATTNGHYKEDKVEEESKGGGNPYFVIDTNPTPFNLPGISLKPTKRTSEDCSSLERVEKNKSKRVKMKHDGEISNETDVKGVEYEDISNEVDIRMKEREEKRKRKEEKKRKRESEGSVAVAGKVAGPVTEIEMPKKKKSKKCKGEGDAGELVSKKRHGPSGEEGEDGEGKMKKRKKTREAAAAI